MHITCLTPKRQYAKRSKLSRKSEVNRWVIKIKNLRWMKRRQAQVKKAWARSASRRQPIRKKKNLKTRLKNESTQKENCQREKKSEKNYEENPMPYYYEANELSSARYTNQMLPYNWELAEETDIAKEFFIINESEVRHKISDNLELMLNSDKFTSTYQYVGLQNRQIDPNTNIVIEKPMVVPRPAKPACSLIVKVSGQDGHFKVQNLLSRIGASGLVYFDKSYSSHEMELIFNVRVHWIAFFRVGFELISQNDPMYCFRTWQIFQQALMVTQIPGDIVNDEVASTYGFIYNCRYPLQELITNICIKYWDDWCIRDLERQIYLSKNESNGARAASRNMQRPKANNYKLDNIMPHHDFESWIARWEAEDRLQCQKKINNLSKESII